MHVYNSLLWVIFSVAWLLVFIVGLVVVVEGGLGFWAGLYQEHHILLTVAFALTGSRLAFSYHIWKDGYESTR